MFLDDFRPWRCQNVVNTSVFSFTSTKIAQNTMFLDVFNLTYLTRNHNNNNNNNNKNIWHLVSLVRADPAAERREYRCENGKCLSINVLRRNEREATPSLPYRYLLPFHIHNSYTMLRCSRHFLNKAWCLVSSASGCQDAMNLQFPDSPLST